MDLLLPEPSALKALGQTNRQVFLYLVIIFGSFFNFWIQASSKYFCCIYQPDLLIKVDQAVPSRWAIRSSWLMDSSPGLPSSSPLGSCYFSIELLHRSVNQQSSIGSGETRRTRSQKNRLAIELKASSPSLTYAE